MRGWRIILPRSTIAGLRVAALALSECTTVYQYYHQQHSVDAYRYAVAKAERDWLHAPLAS